MDNIGAFNLAHEIMRGAEMEIRERTGLKIILRLTSEEQEYINPEIIAAKIADSLGYDMDDIRSKSRHPHLVDTRVIISFMLRNHLGRKISMSEIGSLINVDHSSIVHYLRKAKNMMDIGDVGFIKKYNKAMRTMEMKTP